MVKVVQVIASSDASFGGPSAVAVALSDAISARTDGRSLLLSADYEFNGSHTHGPRTSGSRTDAGIYPPARPYTLMNSRALRSAVNEAAREADLIHIHGQYLLPNLYAYRAAIKNGVQYGVQVHGGLEPYQRRQSKLRKGLWNLLVGRNMLKRASYIHFASESEATRASDVVSNEQVLVEPLGARLSPEPIRPGQLHTDLPSRREVYLYLGRLAQKKRPDLLIRAWANAQRGAESTLVIAGPDEDFTADGLSRLAEELGCVDSVVFVGAVNEHESAFLYRSADTFILPSENENFAVAVAEAMLAGCHVITTEQTAAHTHVLASETGAVLARPDVDLLTAALEQRISDSDERESNRKLASLYAEEFLSWDRLAARLVTIAKGEAFKPSR